MNTPTKVISKFKPKFEGSKNYRPPVSIDELKNKSQIGIKEHKEFSDLVSKYLIDENRDYKNKVDAKIKVMIMLSIISIVLTRLFFF